MSKHFLSVLKVVGEASSPSVGDEMMVEVHEEAATAILPAPPTPNPSSPSPPSSYYFDRIHPPQATPRAVYRSSLRDVVENSLLGYHGTVILLEAADGRGTGQPPLEDAIRRASQQVFRCLRKSRSSGPGTGLLVRCSFASVADERLYDLLSGVSELEKKKGGEGGDRVCERGSEGWQEPPCLCLPLPDSGTLEPSTHEATSSSRLLLLLKHGQEVERRLVRWISTQRQRDKVSIADEAERTHHTVFRITVEYAHFGTINAPVSGTLSFFRLSSSSCLCRQPNSAEEVPSNRSLSLLALAELVSALTESTNQGSRQQQQPLTHAADLHSKSVLTRMLKDGIGGNSKTVFLCFAPKNFAALACAQVHASLELVSRARSILNKPNRRDLAERALMSAYMKEMKLVYESRKGEQGIAEVKEREGEGGGGEEIKKGEEQSCIVVGGQQAVDQSEDDRQRHMQLAATALAQAVSQKHGSLGDESGSSDDNDDEEEQEEGGLQVSVDPLDKQQGKIKSKVKVRLREQQPEEESGKSSDVPPSSDVTIGALVSILQDPDRGVPRALETRLKDVKIRRDVGAVFSGADIVSWMVRYVEGVESEANAEILGQLLLDRGAIVHSEGSMVFANADSLFYYAREARTSGVPLSPEEIQALLSIAREPMVNVTLVSGGGQGEKAGDVGPVTRRREEEGEDARRDSTVSRVKGDSSNGVGEIKEDSFLANENDNILENRGESENVSSELAVDSEDADPMISSYDGLPRASPLPVQCGGDAEEQAVHRMSVESWMLEAEEEENEQRRSREGSFSEDVQPTGSPSTDLQKSIPSIHTLENCQDYPHPLHMAVAIGKHPGVIRNLVMMFGVDKVDDKQRTPLMFAALGNKRSSCSALIDCGADVDKKDCSGLTALHVACYHGSKEAARMLLSKRASVIIKDKMGHTAVHWATVPESSACLNLLLDYCWPALLQQVDSSGLTAIHWTIFYNHPHHLKLLLRRYPDILEVDSAGRTFLTYTIERNLPDTRCMTVLLDVCPSLLAQPDSGGHLPLHMATISPSILPLCLLVKRDPCLVNCVDSHQRTPLHYAAAANRLDSVQVLVSERAEHTAQDSEGRTALDYAKKLRDGHQLEALLQTCSEVEVAHQDGPQGIGHSDTASRQHSTSRVCSLL